MAKHSSCHSGSYLFFGARAFAQRSTYHNSLALPVTASWVLPSDVPRTKEEVREEGAFQVVYRVNSLVSLLFFSLVGWAVFGVVFP